MNQIINISASAAIATIDIEGTIGDQGNGDSVTTYQALKEKLEAIKAIEAPMVVVNIRSVGGDVADALLIYEALRTLDAHITTRCYGYTASAATIIAQAANEGCREIVSSALYLIHNSSCVAEGNAADLQQHAELLSKTDERIAAVYASSSGREAAYYAELMARNGGNGVWLSPEQALEAGLVDVVVAPDTAPTASLLERVASWFGLKRKADNAATTTPPVDNINLRQRDYGYSAIALTEGQNGARATVTSAVEDPDIEGIAITANAAAYNRDVASFL